MEDGQRVSGTPVASNPGANEVAGQVRRKGRRSKRFQLPRLPIGWREAIFSRIRSPRLKSAVAVLTVTGCRPSELAAGALVCLQGERLLVGIQGSKVDERTGRGQPRRAIEVESGAPWSEWLGRLAREAVNGAVVIKYHDKTISLRLSDISRRAFPWLDPAVTAYTYRHFIAAQLRAEGKSRDFIARVLGHATDYSQRAYGRNSGRSTSGTNSGIRSAKVTQPVRAVPKTTRHENFGPKTDVDVCRLN